MQLVLIVMREGFESLNRTLSNTSSNTATAISEAFGTLKGELEIAHEEKSVEESEGTTEEPRAKKRCKQPTIFRWQKRHDDTLAVKSIIEKPTFLKFVLFQSIFVRGKQNIALRGHMESSTDNMYNSKNRGNFSCTS